MCHDKNHSDDIHFQQYLCIRNNPSFLHLPVQDFFFLHISYSSLQQPCEVGIIVTLITIKEWKLREVNSFAEDHITY